MTPLQREPGQDPLDVNGLQTQSGAIQNYPLQQPLEKTTVAVEDMSQQHTRLHTRGWAILRREVFERDNYRCVECGQAGRQECDHITTLQREPRQDAYYINGLQTLCRSCHIAKTARDNRRPPTPAELAWRDLVAELVNDNP